MKSLFIALTMLGSVAAMANTAVFHDYAQVLGPIKLHNACITESEVNSIHPVTICTKMEPTTISSGGEAGTHIDWKCVETETRDLSYSRAFQRNVCLKNAPVNEASSGECLEWGTKDEFLPATIKVRIETIQGEVTSSRVKWFSFPTCD